MLITYIVSDSEEYQIPTNKNLIMRSKNTNVLDTYYVDEDDNVVDLTGGTVFFTIKDKISDTDDNAKLQKKITAHTDPMAGESKISLTPTNTADLSGNYIYSIKLKLSDDTIYTVGEGVILFAQEVTISEN